MCRNDRIHDCLNSLMTERINAVEWRQMIIIKCAVASWVPAVWYGSCIILNASVHEFGLTGPLQQSAFYLSKELTSLASSICSIIVTWNNNIRNVYSIWQKKAKSLLKESECGLCLTHWPRSKQSSEDGRHPSSALIPSATLPLTSIWKPLSCRH